MLRNVDLDAPIKSAAYTYSLPALGADVVKRAGCGIVVVGYADLSPS